MEKRLLLAIALSLVVLLTWSALAPKPQPIVNKSVAIKNATEVQPVSANDSMLKSQLATEPSQPLIESSRNNTELFFDERHAAITKIIFDGHRKHQFPLRVGFLTDDGSLKFTKVNSNSNEISFVAHDGTKQITKRFIFSNSNYSMELQVNIQNISSAPITVDMPIILGILDLSRHNEELRYQDVYLVNQEKTLHLSPSKEYSSSNVKILGLRDRYFCLIVEPVKESYAGFIKKIYNTESEIGLKSASLVLQPGAQIGHLFHIYYGPQDLKMINKINTGWAGIIYFGTFDIISQVLLQALEFLYNIVHNWGWAIVILSILVYLLLYPLSIKQMRSMKEMQAIQPKVEALRKLYKDNPQKMNKEIMELYRLHKVNPFGGCLPLILQMPIFFALYNALMRSVNLKGAHFLWIKDLSEPDRLFTLPVSLPIIGNGLNILPIVMAVGMFFQQKISASAMSGPSAEQQKIMLIVMPVVFGLIFYNMPAGLVLYWLINSMLMLVFQLRINKAK